MKIDPRLIHVKFLKRYKRFFSDVVLNKKKITVHCPNSGSMLGLLNEKNDAWISKSDNPNRKLKFTLEVIKVRNNLVGVNTHKANKIVKHALENKLMEEFKNIKNIKPEFKYSTDTRFDFLCDKNLIEVKNVTLNREREISEFPDAVTSRGSKHLLNLKESIKKGYKPYVLFLTQIQGIKKFKIAKDIDEKYYENYLDAKKHGVKFIAYRCSISDKEIKIENKIKFIDE